MWGEEMDNQEQVSAVSRMQDYIKDNINKPMTLYELSQVAGYSPWHSAKLFKQLTGKTTFEYIRALRLSKAAIKLRDENVKVIDVAFDFVFDSHEGFTRAFAKEFGITPKLYTKSPPPIKLFIPYSVRDYFLMIKKGDKKMEENKKIKPVFVQVVDRDARKLILKRGVKATHYFEYCSEVGCDVWGILSSVKEALHEPMGLWLPKNMVKQGTSMYAQGVEVPTDYNGKVPEGFDIIDLPPCKMMIFQGQPYNDEEFDEEIKELWSVIEEYDPKLYGFEWADEDAPRFQLEPQGYRGYIEEKPVRQMNR